MSEVNVPNVFHAFFPEVESNEIKPDEEQGDSYVYKIPETETRSGMEIVPFSNEALEEDILSAFEASERLLTKEQLNKLQEKITSKILDCIGASINTDVLEQVLPGCTFIAEARYSFTHSRIKLIMLDEEDFSTFFDALGLKKGPEAITDGRIQYVAPPYQIPTFYLNTSEIDIVIIRDPTNSYATKEEAGEQLELLVTHELLHKFGVGVTFNMYFEEGIVEYYANRVLYGDRNDLKPYIKAGYPRQTNVVSILVNALTEAGMQYDAVEAALVGNKQDAKNELLDNLKKVYGEDAAKKIYFGRFKNFTELWKYVKNAEIARGSELGEFLKQTEDLKINTVL